MLPLFGSFEGRVHRMIRDLGLIRGSASVVTPWLLGSGSAYISLIKTDEAEQ